MRSVFAAAIAAFSFISSFASAGDVALLIGNSEYRSGGRVDGGRGILGTADALRSAGFRVIAVTNGSSGQLRDGVNRLATAADGSGRIVIAIAGQFAHAGGLGWVAGTDARRPSIAQISAQGASLNVLMQLAGTSAGQAVVLLTDDNSPMNFGAGLTDGLGALHATQGVALVTGSARDISNFITNDLLVLGQSIAAGLERQPRLNGRGFLATQVPFVADGNVGAGYTGGQDLDAEEKAFWRATESIGSIDAYQRYIDDYPRGLFVAEARAVIKRIEAAPLLRAEADEKALRLKRAQRRSIQQALTILDFDPRGVDGVFGGGSRAAIKEWQRVNRHEPTGYVTRPMMRELATQAERRNAELEAEAEQRRIALEREDRAYWRATGQIGDERGLREYLERYPDGLYAEIATVRLEPFEAERRAAAAAQDRADWDAASAADSIPAYQSYLRNNESGAFVDKAKARIGELDFAAKNAGALQAAARNEERLGMNQGTRRLVEDRLMRLGLKPGPIDGVFDDKSRRAIRRYQTARKLQTTGYLNQRTMVRLLADSILK